MKTSRNLNCFGQNLDVILELMSFKRDSDQKTFEKVENRLWKDMTMSGHSSRVNLLNLLGQVDLNDSFLV
jgi:hypothetical protein